MKDLCEGMDTGQFLGGGLLISLLVLIFGGYYFQAPVVLVGLGGFLLFGILLLRGSGERQEGFRERAKDSKNCDWCGRELPEDRAWCSACGDVFCSQNCFEEHKRERHPDTTSLVYSQWSRKIAFPF
jgi:hypothetical protein